MSKHEIPRTIAERIIINPSTIENVIFCQIDCSIQKRRFIDFSSLQMVPVNSVINFKQCNPVWKGTQNVKLLH